MLLGQILIHQGFCTEKDILEALDAQATGDKRRIGEILLEKGKLTRDQLKTALDTRPGR